MVGQPYVTSIPVLVPGAVSIKRLKATLNGNRVNLAWPAPATGFALQQAGSAGGAAAWSDVPEMPAVANDWNSVAVPADAPAGFFRLRLK
jgi:hypothetical protein